MTDDPRLELAAFLPYRLSVLSNTVSRRIAALDEEEFGLTIGQWRVMAVLGASPGVSATEITERTAMDKVAVSRAVSALVDRGLVRREAAQDDGRRSLLALSEDGRRVYREVVPLALRLERELTDSLSADDLATLEALLDALARAASPDRALW